MVPIILQTAAHTVRACAELLGGSGSVGLITAAHRVRLVLSLSRHNTPHQQGRVAVLAVRGGCSLAGAAPLPTEIPVGIKQVGRKLASRIKGLRDRCAVSLVPVPAPQQLPTSVTMIVSQSDQ